MTKLFEWKSRILRFLSEYEIYIKYVWKFVVALSLFVIINSKLGFVEEISSVPVTLLMVVVCSFLPLGATLGIAAAMILIHLYALSVEAAGVAFVIFLIVFLMYFRFAPHESMVFAITPVLHAMGVPYVLPIVAGLLKKGYAAASIVGGTIVYYFLDGIYKNISMFQATSVGESLTETKMSVAIGQIFENTELFLMMVVFTVSTIAVYMIRKMAMQHAWKIAIVVGVLIQVSGLLVGYILFNISEKMLGMLFGNVLAVAVGFIVEFFCMDLDYSRTERVQFEDDEYYYFVKAVPKKMITSTEKIIVNFKK